MQIFARGVSDTFGYPMGKVAKRMNIGRTFSAGVILLIALGGDARGDEVLYPSKEFAKLDTFEAVAVEDADKLFIKKDYRGAYAAYKAYSIEFANGQALPYVLLRMGRCLHFAGKRNTAIKAYQDVVDYFPDDVRYAAAAMYYIGQCHAQNGNEDKSLAVWAKMVKDKDYVGEANSGTALTALAAAMQKRGDHGEAAAYQWRTAVAFRKTNQRAADEARKSVVYHYAVRSPNQAKLLEFCNEVGGFGWRHKIDKPANSPTYWQHVLGVALGARVEAEDRIEVCRYWDAQMGDRFKDDDAVRVAWFNARLGHDKDGASWAARMDEQFKLTPVTIDRVKQWLSFFGPQIEARSAFYKRHGQPLVAGLKNEQKVALMNHLRHPFRMHDEAKGVMRTVRTADMSDEALRRFAEIVAEYEGEDAFLRTVAKMKDTTYAARTRFDFYYRRAHRNGDYQKKALAEAPLLRKSTEHAQDVVWAQAQLTQWQGQHEEAIKLYRAANRQPQSTWAVIDCRVALKQYDKAIALTRELESLGGGVASAACLKAADIYRIGGDKSKEVTQLQLVLRRYPQSGESSTAHGRLESYGVKIIGGEAEADE